MNPEQGQSIVDKQQQQQQQEEEQDTLIATAVIRALSKEVCIGKWFADLRLVEHLRSHPYFYHTFPADGAQAVTVLNQAIQCHLKKNNIYHCQREFVADNKGCHQTSTFYIKVPVDIDNPPEEPSGNVSIRTVYYSNIMNFVCTIQCPPQTTTTTTTTTAIKNKKSLSNDGKNKLLPKEQQRTAKTAWKQKPVSQDIQLSKFFKKPNNLIVQAVLAALSKDDCIGKWFADARILEHLRKVPHVTAGYTIPTDRSASLTALNKAMERLFMTIMDPEKKKHTK